MTLSWVGVSVIAALVFTLMVAVAFFRAGSIIDREELTKERQRFYAKYRDHLAEIKHRDHQIGKLKEEIQRLKKRNADTQATIDRIDSLAHRNATPF